MTDIKLIEATPEYAGQLWQFRKEVFEHAIIAGFDLPVQKADRRLTIQYAGAIISGKSAETGADHRRFLPLITLRAH